MEWTEEHRQHFNKANELRRAVEAEGAKLGTPGELAIFVAQAASLLDRDSLKAMTLRLENLIGRTL